MHFATGFIIVVVLLTIVNAASSKPSVDYRPLRERVRMLEGKENIRDTFRKGPIATENLEFYLKFIANFSEEPELEKYAFEELNYVLPGKHGPFNISSACMIYKTSSFENLTSQVPLPKQQSFSLSSIIEVQDYNQVLNLIVQNSTNAPELHTSKKKTKVLITWELRPVNQSDCFFTISNTILNKSIGVDETGTTIAMVDTENLPNNGKHFLWKFILKTGRSDGSGVEIRSAENDWALESYVNGTVGLKNVTESTPSTLWNITPRKTYIEDTFRRGKDVTRNLEDYLQFIDKFKQEPELLKYALEQLDSLVDKKRARVTINSACMINKTSAFHLWPKVQLPMKNLFSKRSTIKTDHHHQVLNLEKRENDIIVLKVLTPTSDRITWEMQPILSNGDCFFTISNTVLNKSIGVDANGAAIAIVDMGNLTNPETNVLWKFILKTEENDVGAFEIRSAKNGWALERYDDETVGLKEVRKPILPTLWNILPLK